MKLVIVSIKETSKNVWRITWDGKVLGDSRGYDKARALTEANKHVKEGNICPYREGETYVLQI